MKDTLGISLPPMNFKQNFRVGRNELAVNRLDAAVAMTASLERSHSIIIMTSESFLFRTGKMTEARGFLLETGRLSGVVSLHSSQSFKRSMIAISLIFLSANRKKSVKTPSIFRQQEICLRKI